ncbi:MAG: ribosome recycling factor, partial [Alistipes sp.]|nr:ribosome recycling factor [Alistipes sp.]
LNPADDGRVIRVPIPPLTEERRKEIVKTASTKVEEAKVAIRNVATNKDRYITVKQKGYEYGVEVDRTSVDVKKFAEYGKRYFDVVVKSNFAFDVKIPQSAQHWISREPASNLGEAYQHDLDRGVRPREVKVRFNWKINNSANVRLADIEFVPIADTITVSHSEKLHVSQEAAEPIIPDTRAGDSLALLNIANTMQCWTMWDPSTTMDSWSGVTLWDERMEGCTPEKVGRVKRVEIFLCNSFEGLPFEFQYLTAAEEIYVFSNENSMLKSLNLGEHVCKLTNLKRLTVGAFGLSELPEEFTNLKNLEFLDLGSNNFQRVPSMITKANFPKLRALVLNAQQRHAVSDLSNTRYAVEELGGLVEEEGVPEHLLKWGLDTLVLSVNYLHGTLPSFEDDPEVPKWTEAEVIAADTLPLALVGTPKVMPTTKTFRINHNRLSGELPTWLLMHPALDWWVPFSLVFPQEGRWTDGSSSGFTNAPANLVDYYKNWYPNKKLANSIEEEIPEEDMTKR